MTDKKRDQAARAELIQGAKALFIPLSLFLSCVVLAAGTFLLYNQESLGWIFMVLGGLMIVLAFVALFTFQNQYRVKGVIQQREKAATNVSASSESVADQESIAEPKETNESTHGASSSASTAAPLRQDEGTHSSGSAKTLNDPEAEKSESENNEDFSPIPNEMSPMLSVAPKIKEEVAQ